MRLFRRKRNRTRARPPVTHVAIERQTAPTLDGIEARHLARYRLAAACMPVGGDLLDVACGCGYGSAILATLARSVTGVDRSAEAIEFARAHYGRAEYHVGDLIDDDWATPFSGRQFDGAVSLETLEHLEDPRPYLQRIRALLRPGGRLIVSTPNPLTTPLFVDGKRTNEFHFHHWSLEELRALADEIGFEHFTWFAQVGTGFNPESQSESAQYLLAVMTLGS
jgi:2-polyprenyl-3-methyl-5-hydroxy-6-metoxy-1,4-benzoquinol methylase